MNFPPFHAGYHKLSFKPSKSFTTTDETVNEITSQLFNIPLSNFEKRSSGRSRQYIEVLTYNRFIDLTYKNTKNHGRCLDSVTIQGSAFDYMPFNVEFLQNYLFQQRFLVVELHSKIDIPNALVSFQTIKDHFITHAYVAPGCKQVVFCADPSNDCAETYYAGKRATHGKRVAFYEAGKIHEDLQDVTRMELQLFGRNAQNFFLYTMFEEKPCLDELTEKTMGVISGHIEFKTLMGHQNQSRRAIAPWWENILNGYSKILLPRTFRNPSTLARQKAALKAEFYKKRQKIGEDSFIEAVHEFVAEMGLTERLAQTLRPAAS